MTFFTPVACIEKLSATFTISGSNGARATGSSSLQPHNTTTNNVENANSTAERQGVGRFFNFLPPEKQSVCNTPQIESLRPSVQPQLQFGISTDHSPHARLTTLIQFSINTRAYLSLSENKTSWQWSLVEFWTARKCSIEDRGWRDENWPIGQKFGLHDHLGVNCSPLALTKSGRRMVDGN